MVESRRFFLNFVVGCTGIVTCVMMIFCAIWAESAVDEAIGLPDGPLLGMFGIFLYRLLANVFFTGGCMHMRANRENRGDSGNRERLRAQGIPDRRAILYFHRPLPRRDMLAALRSRCRMALCADRISTPIQSQEFSP